MLLKIRYVKICLDVRFRQFLCLSIFQSLIARSHHSHVRLVYHLYFKLRDERFYVFIYTMCIMALCAIIDMQKILSYELCTITCLLCIVLYNYKCSKMNHVIMVSFIIYRVEKPDALNPQYIYIYEPLHHM